MFPATHRRRCCASGRGSMCPKTIPTLAAFAMRQLGSHARNDNNATRGFKGFKGKGSNYVMPQLRGEIDQLGSAATKPKRSRRAGTLQRLSRFAVPRQTGECLGSGLPFGVRRRRRRFGSRRPVNSPPRRVREVCPPPVTEALHCLSFGAWCLVLV